MVHSLRFRNVCVKLKLTGALRRIRYDRALEWPALLTNFRNIRLPHAHDETWRGFQEVLEDLLAPHAYAEVLIQALFLRFLIGIFVGTWSRRCSSTSKSRPPCQRPKMPRGWRKRWKISPDILLAAF